MVAGGGQIPGIGMAYSIAPLVFYFLIRLGKRFLIKSILLGLVMGLQLLFDLRIFYITTLGVSLFLVLDEAKAIISNLLKFLVIPIAVVLLLHAFWILPLVVFPTNPVENLGPEYSTVEAVRFLSFAKFENTISLLHPNWPENIFGKTQFLKPEFLILPILAFSNLLFIKNENKFIKRTLIFFSILAVLGAFLAKGASEPFGEVYIFLFENFPGFQMFRDSTKFYLLIALSYSILVPYSVIKIHELLKEKLK